MFAHLIAAPLFLIAVLFLYLAWTVDGDYAPWMVPFLVSGAVIYLLAPQINWWWYTRRPPDLPAELRALLERHWPFYHRLPEAGRLKFRQRVALFRMGTDWTALGGWPDDQLPPDVELAVAAAAVTLTFHREEFLFRQFEKVIVYPRPFPTPEYPRPHASELYAPDGCLIFSAEQVMKAFLQSGRMYNVALHEYAQAYRHTYPGEAYPALFQTPVDEQERALWQGLEAASGIAPGHIETVMGLPEPAPLPAAIHHYFMYRERFAQQFPEETRQFDRIFSPPTP